MAQTICVIVSTSDRQCLEEVAADRNRPHKHVERARVVPTSAERGSVQRVAAGVGASRPMVWRWQQRFAEAGVDALLRDSDLILVPRGAAPIRCRVPHWFRCGSGSTRRA
jgi:Homeodomain-like domain